MKKKILIPILIIVILIFGTILFFMVNKKPKESTNTNEYSFYESKEYKKIIDNKDSIIKVTYVSYSEGEEQKTIYDTEKAYNKFKNLNIIQKTDIGVLDADSYYLFEFDDNSSAKIYFEGSFLHYNGNNYVVEYKDQ